jgi:hypothetical protein
MVKRPSQMELLVQDGDGMNQADEHDCQSNLRRREKRGKRGRQAYPHMQTVEILDILSEQRTRKSLFCPV